MSLLMKNQSFLTPIKHNHSDTAPSANNNVFGQFPLGSDPLQCQKYNTTHMTQQKSLHPERIISVFKLMEELPVKHSVPNQDP